MSLRGVRGATSVEQNQSEEIIQATHELLSEMVRVNGFSVEEIASCIFSVTPDLTADFPASAARQLGWVNTALLCTHEMNVASGLPRCIRVLMHVNTDKTQQDIRHVYLRAARALRPDLEQR